MVSGTQPLRIQEPCYRQIQETYPNSKWFSNARRIQEPYQI